MAFTIGKVGKSVEIASEGRVSRDMRIMVDDEMANAVAEKHPTGYLAAFESLCDAMRQKDYVMVADNAVLMACSALRGSILTTHVIVLTQEGDAMYLRSWKLSETELPEGDWKSVKHLLRKK